MVWWGVVSKVRDSRYNAGRGNDWVKVTCRQRETLPIAAGFLRWNATPNSAPLRNSIHVSQNRSGVGSGYSQDGRMIHDGWRIQLEI